MTDGNQIKRETRKSSKERGIQYYYFSSPINLYPLFNSNQNQQMKQLQTTYPLYLIHTTYNFPLWMNNRKVVSLLSSSCSRILVGLAARSKEQRKNPFQKSSNCRGKANMVTKTVDLRSDTVTKPTEAMRAAMATADVDDDVLGSDPTAYRFETEMARIMGKEAALFVPSGTMGNLISVLVHCEVRGSEVILGDDSHIHIYENGGISTIGNVHAKTLKNNSDGTMDISLIEAAIRDPEGELYFPTTRLICLENSHANCGGRCISVEYTDAVGELAKRHGIKLHIDGARIFNASAALGVPVHRLVQAADSVSVCLSKGLGAPIGSVIVGSKIFIAKAKRLRKTLGGGMRQVGILCAAAYVALQENIGKLEGDHRKAKIFADGLNQIKGLKVDKASVETNIIFFDILEGSNIMVDKLAKILEEHGVLVMPISSSCIRIVLHHQISESDVQYSLTCIQQAVLQLQAENTEK